MASNKFICLQCSNLQSIETCISISIQFSCSRAFPLLSANGKCSNVCNQSAPSIQGRSRISNSPICVPAGIQTHRLYISNQRTATEGPLYRYRCKAKALRSSLRTFQSPLIRTSLPGMTWASSRSPVPPTRSCALDLDIIGADLVAFRLHHEQDVSVLAWGAENPPIDFGKVMPSTICQIVEDQSLPPVMDDPGSLTSLPTLFLHLGRWDL